MTKRDDKRHKYAIMIEAHRQEWAKFTKAQIDKPHNADLKAIRSAFAGTSTPREAAKRIKSYFKTDAEDRWKTALKTAWVETGKASITYMHEFLTAKSAFEEDPHIGYAVPILKQDVSEIHQTWDQYIEEKIRESFPDKIKGITDSTQEQVHKVITDGIAEGKSHYEIGQDVDAKLTETWPGRGMTISRTEANSAMNKANLWDALTTVPDMWKTWSITGVNTRQWHIDMDGVSVAMDDKFEVEYPNGMDEMDCPGDDSADGANTINCGCCLIFEPASEEEGAAPTVAQAVEEALKFPEDGFKSVKEINSFLSDNDIAASKLTNKLNLDVANDIGKRVTELYTNPKFGRMPTDGVLDLRQGRAWGYIMRGGRTGKDQPLLIISSHYGEAEEVETVGEQTFRTGGHWAIDALEKTYKKEIEEKGFPYNAIGWMDKEKYTQGLVDHETGHAVWFSKQANGLTFEETREWNRIYNSLNTGTIHRISKYAAKSSSEGFAESYSLYINGMTNNLPIPIVDFFDKLGVIVEAVL